MKRTTIRFLTAVLLAVVLSLSGLLVGCDSTPTFDYKHGSDYLSTEDLSLSEPLTALSVRWVNGSVELRVSDVEGIHIYEDEERDESTEHSFYYYIKDGTTLMIEAGRSGDEVMTEGKALIVEIGRFLCPMLESLSVTTDGASIALSGIVCKQLVLESVSGDITCDVTTESVIAATVSGETALTVGGAKKVEHSSVSGEITVSLRHCSGYTASLDTVSGRLTCPDIEQKDEPLSGFVFGDGSTVVDLITVLGSATVLVVPNEEPPATPEVTP